jgi:DNA-directed RNA polymerase subunit RPC12/RpoP
MFYNSYNPRPSVKRNTNGLTYYKCSDCLTAFTAKETNLKECQCGGKLECMGEVYGGQYKRLEDATACDARCTDAQGPSCNCKCNGENHGTGRTVKVVVESGIARIVEMPAKAKVEQGTAYRELLTKAQSAFEARHGEASKKIASGIFINREEYFACIDARKSLSGIKGMRQFKSRQQALEAYIARMGTGE